MRTLAICATALIIMFAGKPDLSDHLSIALSECWINQPGGDK